MGLLYHVLPGSDMFGESGRAWQHACPEPFYNCWAMWWWEREINTLQPTASFSQDRLS